MERYCSKFGYNQRIEVEELVKQSELYNEVVSKKDLCGNDRVILIM